MSDSKLKIVLTITFVLVLIVSSTLLISYRQKTTPQKPTPTPTPSQSPQIAPLSLAPEKIEIIQKMETRQVSIKSTGFEPPELRVKVHDQVTWTNDDNKNHKVSGEGWGNVPIAAGGKYTKAFEKAGTFSYSCSLQPTLKGKIIVE